jgi:NAD(P)-dependent dehydrogenase (short-subunit alcohol dehydrogenase family)
VLAVDICKEMLSEVVQPLQSAGAPCVSLVGDVSNPGTSRDAVQLAVESYGRIDFLFNNAGIKHISSLLETPVDVWHRVLDVNLTGAMLMTTAALPVMIRQKSGVIVNNSSDAGLRGMRMSASYSVSKAALVHLTKSIALDYAEYGVRCNCICPGCIRTPLCEEFNKAIGECVGKSGDSVLQNYVNEFVPMKRVGEPEEVSSVVLFLCSRAASYVNGAVISIDGGSSAGV